MVAIKSKNLNVSLRLDMISGVLRAKLPRTDQLVEKNSDIPRIKLSFVNSFMYYTNVATVELASFVIA